MGVPICCLWSVCRTVQWFLASSVQWRSPTAPLLLWSLSWSHVSVDACRWWFIGWKFRQAHHELWWSAGTLWRIPQSCSWSECQGKPHQGTWIGNSLKVCIRSGDKSLPLLPKELRSAILVENGVITWFFQHHSYCKECAAATMNLTAVVLVRRGWMSAPVAGVNTVLYRMICKAFWKVHDNRRVCFRSCLVTAACWAEVRKSFLIQGLVCSEHDLFPCDNSSVFGLLQIRWTQLYLCHPPCMWGLPC